MHYKGLYNDTKLKDYMQNGTLIIFYLDKKDNIYCMQRT